MPCNGTIFLWSCRGQIALALAYVAQTYPWFNMSRGRDHFVWTTGELTRSCMLLGLPVGTLHLLPNRLLPNAG